MSIFKKAPKNSKWIKVLTEEIFYRVSKAGQYSLDEKGPRQIVSELIKYLPNVMESWESRLLALGASFDEWQQLIRTYHRLGLQTKVESSIAKAQGLLSLSKGQVEELKIQTLTKNRCLSNCHIYNFHASKIQNLGK